MYSSRWHIFASILLFFICEGVFTAFLRVFGYYTQQMQSQALFPSERQYWWLLGGLIALYFVLCFVKMMALSLTIMTAN